MFRLDRGDLRKSACFSFRLKASLEFSQTLLYAKGRKLGNLTINTLLTLVQV